MLSGPLRNPPRLVDLVIVSVTVVIKARDRVWTNGFWLLVMHVLSSTLAGLYLALVGGDGILLVR